MVAELWELLTPNYVIIFIITHQKDGAFCPKGFAVIQPEITWNTLLNGYEQLVFLLLSQTVSTLFGPIYGMCNLPRMANKVLEGDNQIWSSVGTYFVKAYQLMCCQAYASRFVLA